MEKVQKIVRLPAELAEKIRIYADERGMSENDVFIQAIIFYLKHSGQEVIPYQDAIKMIIEKDKMIAKLIDAMTIEKKKRGGKR